MGRGQVVRGRLPRTGELGRREGQVDGTDVGVRRQGTPALGLSPQGFWLGERQRWGQGKASDLEGPKDPQWL